MIKRLKSNLDLVEGQRIKVVRLSSRLNSTRQEYLGKIGTFIKQDIWDANYSGDVNVTMTLRFDNFNDVVFAFSEEEFELVD